MTAARPAWRDRTAILAAYLLVLQVLLAGLAAGLSVAPALAAGPDGTICHGARPDPSPADRDGAPLRHVADACCVLGCAAFGPLVAPPSSAGDLPARGPAAASRMDTDRTYLPPPRGGAWSANLARAPPA
ncbi:hypothetical protein EZH22_09145 [Xanthobacter dioxanivorans]|uniref:DUF2946 domain-containing protein n=1 Tax=Xanthobacter dioxanivorans TaxID=2528964 RepID=A0A974PSF7_9HYPH|nr:hypothetical protein [Xanthobacter dioxanivorans]QRG08433.1 hypothetical protein EZH22_09145 [Xanthobacter dioxanivorans]